SHTVDPSSTRPRRTIAPALKRRASASEVLPAPPCPTSATLRIFAVGNVFTDDSPGWALLRDDSTNADLDTTREQTPVVGVPFGTVGGTARERERVSPPSATRTSATHNSITEEHACSTGAGAKASSRASAP